MQLEGTIANSTKMTAEDFEKLVEFRRPLGARIRAKGDSEDGRREGIPPEPGGQAVSYKCGSRVHLPAYC